MLRGDLPYPHGTRFSPLPPPQKTSGQEGSREGGRVTEGPGSTRCGPFLPTPTRCPSHLWADPLGWLPLLASPRKPLISVLPLDLTPGLGIHTHGRPGTYCSVPSGRVFPGPQVSRISACGAGAAPGHSLARALSHRVSLGFPRSPGYSLRAVTPGPQSYCDREPPSPFPGELNTGAGVQNAARSLPPPEPPGSCWPLLNRCCLRPRKTGTTPLSRVPSAGGEHPE